MALGVSMVVSPTSVSVHAISFLPFEIHAFLGDKRLGGCTG